MTSLNANTSTPLNINILRNRAASLLVTKIDLHSSIKSFKNHKKQLVTTENKFNINTKKTFKEANLVTEFINIYQQHQQDKRWILMIDPEQKDIDTLSKNNTINSTKILRINSKKVNLSTKNIENTLIKGNCCAIILCNSNFDQQQLSTFNHYAKQGNTQCIVLNNEPVLH
ncbi:MAG: hypothetical protein JKX78_04770 [Alteromonadaceae bacterium]|nr:hypothetical protein [Alteromonadaceae bacterium]